jgi:hypothetical protein
MFLYVLAVGIYGTPQKPRHPVFRNTVRLIAFGGSAILLAELIGLVSDIHKPMAVIFVWGVCGLIVILAEYDLGSPKIAIVALMVVALLFGLALWPYF